MARIALLYHPPGTRLFTVRDGKAVACEVKDVRVEREHLERREADHAVALDGADEVPVGDLPMVPYGLLWKTADEALKVHAALEAGSRDRLCAETQASVVEWTNSRYPEEKGDSRAKLMNLIEEVAELVRQGGIDAEAAVAHFRASAERPVPEGDADAALGGEIGDVGIAFYDVAEAFGQDADHCRDLKMAQIRKRTPEECAERQARKREKGL